MRYIWIARRRSDPQWKALRTHRCGKLLDMFHCSSSSIVYTRYELVVVGSLVLYDIDA